MSALHISGTHKNKNKWWIAEGERKKGLTFYWKYKHNAVQKHGTVDIFPANRLVSRSHDPVILLKCIHHRCQQWPSKQHVAWVSSLRINYLPLRCPVTLKVLHAQTHRECRSSVRWGIIVNLCKGGVHSLTNVAMMQFTDHLLVSQMFLQRNLYCERSWMTSNSVNFEIQPNCVKM